MLQHLPTELARKYIAEFARILRPNGLMVFQLPARFVQEQELPIAAFSAVITCRLDNLTLEANEIAQLEVKVLNSSPVAWNYNEPFSIALGNHWLAADGSILVTDDGRERVPVGFGPRQETDMFLQVRAPAVAGNYLLELDVVQERVAWFKHRGSKNLSYSGYRACAEVVSYQGSIPFEFVQCDARFVRRCVCA